MRSVGGAPGSGSRCLKSVMTVAFAQAGSERSASMVGASLVLMRATRATGRALVICAAAGGFPPIFVAGPAAKALTQNADMTPASAAAFKAATMILRCTRAAPLAKRHRHKVLPNYESSAKASVMQGYPDEEPDAVTFQRQAEGV